MTSNTDPRISAAGGERSALDPRQPVDARGVPVGPAAEADRSDVSIAGLLRSLADDTTSLVSKELSLARAEVGRSLDETKAAVASLAIGAGVAFSGFLVLLASLVYALVELGGFARWSAALIVGAVVTVVGLVLLASARSKLAASNLVPDRTLHSLQKDQDMVRSKVS